MKGRKPLPSNVKQLKGTDKPSRRNDNEPKPAKDAIVAPRGMTPVARRHFKKTMKELEACGIVTNIDIDAMRLYCETFARWLDAQQKILETGMIVKGSKGSPMVSPYLRIANDCFNQMRMMLTEFGMTPSSRTRVNAGDTGKEAINPFTQFGKTG